MQRPLKRPRLGCHYPSSDSELQLKRARHDLHLKSRFEKIFEKYGKDFSETADEVDLETGEIVVDKGHLAAMINETDPGSLGNSEQQDLDGQASGDELGGQEKQSSRPLERSDTVTPHLHARGTQLGSSTPLRDPTVIPNEDIQCGRHSKRDAQLHRPNSPNRHQSDRPTLQSEGPTAGTTTDDSIEMPGSAYRSNRPERPALEAAWQAPPLPETSLWREGRRPSLAIDLEDAVVERSPSPPAGSLWAPLGANRSGKIDGRTLRRGQPNKWRKWTKEEDELLLKVKTTTDLTTVQMEPYFPGRTWAAIQFHSSAAFRDVQRPGDDTDGIPGGVEDQATLTAGIRSEGNTLLPRARTSKTSPLRSKNHQATKTRRKRPLLPLRSKSSPLRNVESPRQQTSVSIDDFDELGDYPLESRLSALRLTKSLPKARRVRAGPVATPPSVSKSQATTERSNLQVQDPALGNPNPTPSNELWHADSEDELAETCGSVLGYRRGPASAPSLRASSRSSPFTPVLLRFSRGPKAARKSISPQITPVDDSSEDELATPVKFVRTPRTPLAELA